MVLYFKSDVTSPPTVLYMGKDKYENEELIRWGWPEDVWFHVEHLSSAHVYVRLESNQTIDDIPSAVITDAAQLVKANSIQGNKINNVNVIYTMWENLKKTADMVDGQVAFHNNDRVKKTSVDKRNNAIVNRLNKTKTEEYPDLRVQREERDSRENQRKKETQRLQKAAEAQEAIKKKADTEMRSYTTLLKSENMSTNYDNDNDSDEFM